MVIDLQPSWASYQLGRSLKMEFTEHSIRIKAKVLGIGLLIVTTRIILLPELLKQKIGQSILELASLQFPC
jgi:hypothetical protein